MTRKARIEQEVERCGEVCPYYRKNECADHGTEEWCEAGRGFSLDAHFYPTRNVFNPKEVPAFPEFCPLEES